MHLRPPSVDHGVQAFIWAVVFFLFLWFGMLAVGVSQATAFVLALVLGLIIFLFVRIFGEEDLARPQAGRPRRRIP
jgi:glycerol uptake facilitator-like aquaporin